MSTASTWSMDSSVISRQDILVPGHVTHVVDRHVERPNAANAASAMARIASQLVMSRLDQGGLAAGLLDPLGRLLGALP